MSQILVVDDEAIITMQLEERLSALGYSVGGMAASGEEAVEKARRVRPDLVLMDIVMPGRLNGIDAAKIITDELDIPVIFVTAYADDNIIKSAKSVKPYGYIVKPFNELELKATIEIALFRKEMESRIGKPERTLEKAGLPGDLTGGAESEYLNIPETRTLLLKDIFKDIVLFLYTDQTEKEPIFKFVLEEACKKGGRNLFSYYHSSLQKYFLKEIRNEQLSTYRIKRNELYTLIPVLEKCTASLQPPAPPVPFQILFDLSDTREFSDIIAVKSLLFARKETGIPVSGVIAVNISDLDHNLIESLAEGVQKIIVATGKETMLSFANHTFPAESLSVVPQSTIDDVVKKLLEPVVLSLLGRPISGYDIVHEIHDRYKVIVPQARVYTILYALEKQGFLEKKISGKSKMYSTTEKGRMYITQKMGDYSRVFQHIIGGGNGDVQSRDQLNT